MKHYRVNKLATPDGPVIKKMDMLAPDDRQAVKEARAGSDCPICDVLSNGEKIASIT